MEKQELNKELVKPGTRATKGIKTMDEIMKKPSRRVVDFGTFINSPALFTTGTTASSKEDVKAEAGDKDVSKITGGTSKLTESLSKLLKNHSVKEITEALKKIQECDDTEETESSEEEVSEAKVNEGEEAEAAAEEAEDERDVKTEEKE